MWHGSSFALQQLDDLGAFAAHDSHNSSRNGIGGVDGAPSRLRLPRREIPISEAVFSFGDPEFFGSPDLHHEGRTTLVFKCNGTVMLKLICMPELAVYFPANY